MKKPTTECLQAVEQAKDFVGGSCMTLPEVNDRNYSCIQAFYSKAQAIYDSDSQKWPLIKRRLIGPRLNQVGYALTTFNEAR